MRRLVPVERAAHHLPQRLVRGKGRQREIQRQRQRPGPEGPVPRTAQRDPGNRQPRHFRPQEQHQHRAQQPAGQRGGNRMLDPQQKQPETPQEGRQKELDQRAQEQHLHPQEPPRPQRAPQRHRVAHVHRIGHRIALEPARALLDPGPDAAIRLFQRDGVDQFGPVSVPRQAHAQVGILGHVVRVPAPQLLEQRAAKEQRRPPQRHDQPQPVQPRQHQPEPHGVFDGETAAQPVGCGVVIVEHPLQAGHRRGQFAEPARDAEKLVGVGRILGVIDADDRPARKAQRIVQGARLGAQGRMRHRDHPHPAGQVRRGQRIAGQPVILFDDQQDIQPVARIVQRAQPRDQPGGDIGLVIHRHHDRDHGQAPVAVRCRASARVRPLLGQGGRDRDGPRLRQRRRDLERGSRRLRRDHDRKQGDQRGAGRPHQPRRQRQRRRQHQAVEPAGIALAARHGAGHAGFGMQAQRLAPAGQQRVLDAPLGGQRQRHGAENRL